MEWLLPILLGVGGNLLGSLFGGSSDNTQKSTSTTTTNPGYQSPILGLMDVLMGNLSTQNYSRLANWGYPKGMGMDTSLLNQISKYLGSEGTTLLNKYKNASTEDAAAEKKNCLDGCAAMARAGTTGQEYQDCIDKCNKLTV